MGIKTQDLRKVYYVKSPHLGTDLKGYFHLLGPAYNPEGGEVVIYAFVDYLKMC